MRFSLKPKLFSVRILTLIRCVELTKIKKHWSFDKGIHTNRFTDAQRIIIREK